MQIVKKGGQGEGGDEDLKLDLQQGLRGRDGRKFSAKLCSLVLHQRAAGCIGVGGMTGGSTRACDEARAPPLLSCGRMR